MKRFVSALVASLALLAFATPSFAADTIKATKSSTTATTSDTTATKPLVCPKGQTMVKGYKKKDGTVVKAYCRKAR